MHTKLLSLCLACWLTLLSSYAQGFAQLAAKTFFSETGKADCKGGRIVLRRPIVRAPNGYEAYAEIESKADSTICSNVSRLFFKKSGDRPFQNIYGKLPNKDESFNDLKIVDWSPNSQYLLAELSVGQWGSDWGIGIPVIYDVLHEKATSFNWLERGLNTYFGRKCSVHPVIESKGFVPSGSIMIRIRPSRDMGEGTLEPDSCIKQDRLLLVDPITQRVMPFSGNPKIQRYGVTVKRNTKTD